jgi:hypothetical protein
MRGSPHLPVNGYAGTDPSRTVMPLIPETAVFQQRLAALPLATYQPGETVFAAGSRTGRLLILRKGAVAIFNEGIEIREGDRARRSLRRTLRITGSAA